MKLPLLLPLLLLTAACDCDDCDDYYCCDPPSPRYVSIQVEVYDPATNYVWENVSVRIVEADQEWSQSTYTSPQVHWILTDRDGLVYFDEYLIAAAEVGFYEDQGAAIIYPDSWNDEATVWLEVAAEGFTPVIVGVPVSWSQPDAFVSVPFN